MGCIVILLPCYCHRICHIACIFLPLYLYIISIMLLLISSAKVIKHEMLFHLIVFETLNVVRHVSASQGC